MIGKAAASVQQLTAWTRTPAALFAITTMSAALLALFSSSGFYQYLHKSLAGYLTGYPHHAMSVSLRQSQPLIERSVFVVGNHNFAKEAQHAAGDESKLGFCITPTNALNEVHACLLRMSQIKVKTPVYIQYDQSGWNNIKGSKRLTFSYRLDPKRKPKDAGFINLEQVRQTFFLFQTAANGFLLNALPARVEVAPGAAANKVPLGWPLVESLLKEAPTPTFIVTDKDAAPTYLPSKLHSISSDEFVTSVTSLTRRTET